MASDNHAHYSRIGLIVVIGVAAIAATLIYMGGFHDPSSEVLVETYSDLPVTGLSVGSPVNLFGVKVGEVREIAFAVTIYENLDTNDFGRVCLVLAIHKKSIGYSEISDDSVRNFIRERTKSGLRATITSNGITGLARVDLRVVENEPLPQAPAWTPRYALILPAPSFMDSFAVAATKVMNKLKSIDLDASWSNLTQLVTASVRVAENVDALVESRRAGVSQIIGDLGEASSSLKELSHDLKANPSLLLRPSDPEALSETR